MKAEPKGLTLIIHRDGALDSRTVRLPLWLVRAAVGVTIAIAILGLLGAAF